MKIILIVLGILLTILFAYSQNEKFEKEQCLIFASGTKTNKDNLYNQVVNGVGCSTEIKLSHKNVGRILSLIQITKNN